MSVMEKLDAAELALTELAIEIQKHISYPEHRMQLQQTLQTACCALNKVRAREEFTEWLKAGARDKVRAMRYK